MFHDYLSVMYRLVIDRSQCMAVSSEQDNKFIPFIRTDLPVHSSTVGRSNMQATELSCQSSRLASDSPNYQPTVLSGSDNLGDISRCTPLVRLDTSDRVLMNRQQHAVTTDSRHTRWGGTTSAT
jgi:hypothetical protein